MSFARLASKKTFILVHGAWHGQWSWKYVTPLLKKHGHNVIDSDLPGHGKNEVKFRGITLSTYVNHVTDLVKAQKMPVILAGHSMAGVIISQVAENIPQDIDKLVYIAAFIPGNNESLMQEGKKSKSLGVSTEISIDEQKNEIDLKKTSRVQELFFNCCTENDAKLGMSLLQKEPFRPFVDPIKISDERLGKVKKLYIECLQDNAVAPEDQKRMYTLANCDVVSINADHSPFFSAVDELVNAILNCKLENKLTPKMFL